MKFIIGLGNPGKKYQHNRHNIGFMAIDMLAHEFDVSMRKRKYDARHGSFSYKRESIMLVKPQTFMNESGVAVKQIVDYYQGNPSTDVLIIIDDIHLSFGTVRIRSKGSAGGHNGLQSIIDYLGTGVFARLRIGVDKPPDYMDLSSYVLQDFTREETKELPPVLAHITDIASFWITHTATEVMQRFN